MNSIYKTIVLIQFLLLCPLTTALGNDCTDKDPMFKDCKIKSYETDQNGYIINFTAFTDSDEKTFSINGPTDILTRQLITVFENQETIDVKYVIRGSKNVFKGLRREIKD